MCNTCKPACETQAPGAGNVHSAEDDFWQAVLLGMHQPSVLDQLLAYCSAVLERLRVYLTKEN